MNAPEADLLVSRTAEDLAEQFRCEVLTGLSQTRKVIPARWFYDRRGSELFEQITDLPEYYPTRTEIGILRGCGPDVAEQVGPGRVVVEFGAGSTAKTPLLLDCIAPSAYVPIDISGDFLRDSCAGLEQRYPGLPIMPIEADFMQRVSIPVEDGVGGMLGFFPGSTIGNMRPAPAVDLLRSMRETLGDGSMLLIGMDRIKDRERLHAAYDDAAGVTAAFNLNVAQRINRELGGTIPLDGLAHEAVWNDRLARIEMHLKATRPISFEICGKAFAMDAGETIHTENSHKYSRRSGNLLLLAGGWEPVAHYTDEEDLFMVVLARAISHDMTA
jgi:L-histidine N-alpha-methyltransferase